MRRLIVTLAFVPALALAQTPSAAENPQAAEVASAGQPQTAGRPTITVSDFEYGAVAAQISGDKNTRKRLERMGVRDGAGFAAALGIGAADLVVEKLLETGAFRVLERKMLNAVQQEQSIQAQDTIVMHRAARVARARYIVSGSVTRLGFEDKHLGGLAGRAASTVFLYGVGARTSKTEVHLTARVIDTETGEIVASFTGEGVSHKGWGITVFGMGGWGLGGGKAGTENVRESAIGEATDRAAANIVEQIGRARPTLVAGI